MLYFDVLHGLAEIPRFGRVRSEFHFHGELLFRKGRLQVPVFLSECRVFEVFPDFCIRSVSNYVFQGVGSTVLRNRNFANPGTYMLLEAHDVNKNLVA